ncbi:16S rRNA (guanine(966)-N(2))-methyltransferase RsmD [Clostridium neuense]|uniref:16S rRNA (Guanine(966)-N(2))-methyltransferase RsmD n=1 Tax=Clostridium neuense TaxID=1728934 RepID=A0ABW8TCG4_9CLOT
MRIISGIAKGRKLFPPASMVTRPTLDRVKESIFDIIQNEVPYSVVLDAFAGTGSLGLEAVSRGAKSCILIDQSPETYSLLRKNVENLKFEDKCQTINMDSYKALKDLGYKNREFDLIFIDPPYSKDMIPPAVDIITDKNMLKNDGLIVTKIDSEEEIYEGNKSIVLTRYKKYGNTTICFYKHKED